MVVSFEFSDHAGLAYGMHSACIWVHRACNRTAHLAYYRMGPAVILCIAAEGLLGWPGNGDRNFEKLLEIAPSSG